MVPRDFPTVYCTGQLLQHVVFVKPVETPPHDVGLDTGLDTDILVIQNLLGPVAGVTAMRDPAASAFIFSKSTDSPSTLDLNLRPHRYFFEVCFLL